MTTAQKIAILNGRLNNLVNPRLRDIAAIRTELRRLGA